MKNNIHEIIKRDGKIVPFDQQKITVAIAKAAGEVKEPDETMPQRITEKVVVLLNEKFAPPRIPQVEEIQDLEIGRASCRERV